MHSSESTNESRKRVLLFGTGQTGEVLLNYFLKRDDFEIVGFCTNCNIIHRNFLFRLKVLLIQSLFDLQIFKPRYEIFHDFSEKVSDPAVIAEDHNIKCYDFTTVKLEEFLNDILVLELDYIFCFGFPKLIPKRIIDTVKYLSINIHPGFLPERGGGTPIRWAIYHGDTKVGLSAHIMTNKFDDGKIIECHATDLLSDDSAPDVERKLIGLFPNLMDGVLLKIHSFNKHKNKSNDVAPDILPPMRGKHNQIDWNKHSAEDIKKITLAMRPKASAYTFFKGRNLHFWNISIYDSNINSEHGVNGEIITILENGNIVVKTCSGHAEIHSILFGYKIRSTKFVVKKLNIKKGDRFG